MNTATKKANTRTRAKQKPIPPDWINQTEAATWCGVSVRMFQRYNLDPIERRGRHTYYERRKILDCIEERAHRKGYEAGLRDGRGELPEDAADMHRAKDAAELALTRERAETQRLRNAEMRRELAPVEMLTWALSHLAAQIVPIVNSIPGDLKRQNPKISNAETHATREVIANALNLIAELRINFDEYEEQTEATG